MCACGQTDRQGNPQEQQQIVTHPLCHPIKNKKVVAIQVEVGNADGGTECIIHLTALYTRK